MATQVKIYRYIRPKGRRPIWKVEVRDGYRRVFFSDWVAIKFWDRSTAMQFAAFVELSWQMATWVYPPGHQPTTAPSCCSWRGLFSGGGTAYGRQLNAVRGPKKATWLWKVEGVACSTDWPGLQATKRTSARWLCEVFAAASCTATNVARPGSEKEHRPVAYWVAIVTMRLLLELFF